MRGSLATCCLWLLCAATALAETYPHPATVTALNVTSRSGPTYGSYPTERLAKHSQVEVLKEGPSGWVAIRPPRGAFDWLPATAVKLAPDRKSGEIVSDSIPAYLGSNVRKVDKHVAHVNLKQGDSIRILAEKSIQNSDGKPTVWLKIAPPADDFRWVQAKHLSSQSPNQLAAAETAERLAREDRYRRENAADPPGLLPSVMTGDARAIADGRSDSEVEKAQFLRRGRAPLLSRKRDQPKKSENEGVGSIEIEKGTPTETLESDDEETESPRVVGTDAPSADNRTEPGPARPRVSLDPKGLAPRLSERIPRRDSQPPAARETPRETPPPAKPAVEAGTQIRSIDSEEFKRRLTQLEVDLTSMVAGDPSTWNLGSLSAQARELIDVGPSARERGKARLVLDRINEFAATLPADQAELVLAPPANQPAAPAPKANLEAHYDAVGYLMPIVGGRPGTPQYQLTDKDGRTLSFVTARPGVNLNHYVKKQVGLYGQRGYVESLKKPHVVAERVVELDSRRR
jgi:hypothetical protein